MQFLNYEKIIHVNFEIALSTPNDKLHCLIAYILQSQFHVVSNVQLETLQLSRLFCPFRWVKFEEDVEDGSNRWSKPHVATLSLHSLFELRNLLTKGTILLDMEASKYEINFIHLLGSFLSLSTIFFHLLVFFHVIHYNVSLV